MASKFSGERKTVTKSCPTLCNPMDCSPPGSSDHGISQVRIRDRGAIPFFRGCSQPRIEHMSSAAPASVGRFFTTAPPRKPPMFLNLNKKLEMIKLSEEIKPGWKLGLLNQLPKLWIQRKSYYKEIKSATPANTWMMRKQNSLVADMEKVLVNQTIHNVPLSQSLLQSTALTNSSALWRLRGARKLQKKSLKLAEVGS